MGNTLYPCSSLSVMRWWRWWSILLQPRGFKFNSYSNRKLSVFFSSILLFPPSVLSWLVVNVVQGEKHVLNIRQIKYIIKFLTQQLLNELWMALSPCVDACSGGGGGGAAGLTKPRYAGLQSSLTVNISRLIKISNKLVRLENGVGRTTQNCGHLSPRWPKTESSQRRMFFLLILAPLPSDGLSSAMMTYYVFTTSALRNYPVHTMHPGILTYLVASSPHHDCCQHPG